MHKANGRFYTRFMPLVENRDMTALFLRFVALGTLCTAFLGGGFAAPADAEPVAANTVQVSQFSGKPVPRFESLRYTAVHGRQGPSLDHPILWRYEKEGLPMLIVRETHGWRRVRDRDGDEVWIQARMLRADRKVVTTEPILMFDKPADDANPTANLQKGVIADLEGCDRNWCEIKIERRKGWVSKSSLWGVETATGGL